MIHRIGRVRAPAIAGLHLAGVSSDRRSSRPITLE